MFITAVYDETTLANLNAALDQACTRLPPELDTYPARKRIANKLVDSVQKGDASLDRLTVIGRVAAEKVLSSTRRPTGRMRKPIRHALVKS
jgi:hypothetical protein